MKQLWSPWRMDYILGERRDGCVFCNAFAAEDVKDRELLILHRGTHCCVIMNLYPYNNGHLMVIPYAHQTTFEGLPAEALVEVMSLMNKSVSVLREALNAEAFNIGVNLGKSAGAAYRRSPKESIRSSKNRPATASWLARRGWHKLLFSSDKSLTMV